jgi:hypothetical protein
MAPPAGFAPRAALAALPSSNEKAASPPAPRVSAATVKRRLSLKAKEKEKEKPARRPAKQEKTQQRTGVSKPSEKAPRDSAMEPRRFGSEAPRGGSEPPSPRDEDRLAA